MIIGCPKEIKNNEYRVAVTPSSAHAYVHSGHKVLIQKNAGIGSGFSNRAYEDAGAIILDEGAEVWESSEMIVKVKEPLKHEYDFMREGQIIFTYFHFAASESLTKACLNRKIIAIAYETVQDNSGRLPLLKPMSEVAGRMAPLMGAYYLGCGFGGRGILPTGVPGVSPATYLILGGGTVGSNSAKVAAGLGARVIVLDLNVNVLEELGNNLPANVFPIYSNVENLEKYIREADVIVGAVLVPGAKAPKLITKELLQLVRKGAVLVDVAIDQGGCFETSKPTTHSNPVYAVGPIIHYCVANMPGAYAKTSTYALNNVTTPYGLKIAENGPVNACKKYHSIKTGLNIYKGIITCRNVATAFNLLDQYKDPDKVL